MGMILLSLVVVIYVASGGLRAVAYVDTMQCVLLAGGIITLGLISFYYIGGLTNLTQGIVTLSQSDTKLTQDGYSHYVAIPGMIQFVEAGPKAIGGPWTGIMILTYMFALMGIQSAPAFTMCGLSQTKVQSPLLLSKFGLLLLVLVLFCFSLQQYKELAHIF